MLFNYKNTIFWNNKNMKEKIFLNKQFFYIITMFFVISISSIYSFSSFISDNIYTLAIRQAVFYIVGIFIILGITKIGIKKILKYSTYIYLINVFLLVLVLIIGKEINGTKAWFQIPIFGSFQPSEFMKIGLVLMVAKIINNSKLKTIKDEIILIIKVLVITFIPSLITFLEPDTGAVLIYLVIAFIMLFISGIKRLWFILLFLIVALILGSILYLYFFKSDLFISILGSDFFYRLDRLLDWSSSSGMQLENSIIAIASSGLIGNGFNNILLYFPEGHTDFIFTSFASIFGLVGISILLITIVLFDLLLISTAKRVNDNIYKYIIIGFLGVILYQQIQNIAMTIGLLPITGITLPFISYGGSSLLSFMVILGIIISIKNTEHKKTRKMF